MKIIFGVDWFLKGYKGEISNLVYFTWNRQIDYLPKCLLKLNELSWIGEQRLLIAIANKKERN